MKKPLEPNGNIKDDLLYWIKEYLSSKVLANKVEKKYQNTFNRDRSSNAILSAKDAKNLKESILNVKNNGMQNIGSYYYPIMELYEFVSRQKKIQKLNEFDNSMRDKLFILDKKNHSKKTSDVYLMQINSFFRFIEQNNKEDHRFYLGRTRGGKKTKSPVVKKDDEFSYLDENEFNYFIKQLEKYPFKSENAAKPKLMIKVAIYGGLRSEELASIERESVDVVDAPTEILNKGRFLRIYIEGKGQKERVIYIEYDLVKTEYESYLKDVEKCEGKLFFCTEQGKKYTTSAIYQLTKRLLDNMGLDIGKAGIHLLRRSYASYLAVKDVDFAVISSLLGHHNEEVTELYVHISSKGLRPIAKKWKDF